MALQVLFDGLVSLLDRLVDAFSSRGPNARLAGDLETAAARLGLGYSSYRMYGRLDGVEVSASLLDGIVSAKLPRPLAMGLDVAARAPGDGALGVPARRIAAGPKLQRFRTCARERALAAELLRGEVEDLLLDAARSNLSPRIDDERVELVWTEGASSIDAAMKKCVRIAHALESARSRLPRTDHDDTLAVSWENVARSLAARFDPGREELTLDLGFARLTAKLALNAAQDWRTEIDLVLGKVIADTLCVTKTKKHGAWDLWTGLDIRLTDPAFDEAFVVRGTPEDRVRALMSKEVRNRLCSLDADTDDLVLRSDGLFVGIDRVVTDMDELTRLLRDVVALAEELSPRATKGGPYR